MTADVRLQGHLRRSAAKQEKLKSERDFLLNDLAEKKVWKSKTCLRGSLGFAQC